jgi:hypothetical protein
MSTGATDVALACLSRYVNSRLLRGLLPRWHGVRITLEPKERALRCHLHAVGFRQPADHRDQRVARRTAPHAYGHALRRDVRHRDVQVARLRQRVENDLKFLVLEVEGESGRGLRGVGPRRGCPASSGRSATLRGEWCGRQQGEQEDPS